MNSLACIPLVPYAQAGVCLHIASCLCALSTNLNSGCPYNSRHPSSQLHRHVRCGSPSPGQDSWTWSQRDSKGNALPRAMKHRTAAQGWVQAQGAELPPTPTISLTWAGWGCGSTSAPALQHLVPSPGSLPHCSRLMPTFFRHCTVSSAHRFSAEAREESCSLPCILNVCGFFIFVNSSGPLRTPL